MNEFQTAMSEPCGRGEFTFELPVYFLVSRASITLDPTGRR